MLDARQRLEEQLRKEARATIHFWRQVVSGCGPLSRRPLRLAISLPWQRWLERARRWPALANFYLSLSFLVLGLDLCPFLSLDRPSLL